MQQQAKVAEIQSVQAGEFPATQKVRVSQGASERSQGPRARTPCWVQENSGEWTILIRGGLVASGYVDSAGWEDFLLQPPQPGVGVERFQPEHQPRATHSPGLPN